MEEVMHRAAQYLAAAGISFLKKRDDDSHTNLGWRSDLTSLLTYKLNKKGDKLALNYNSFSLEWVNGETVSENLLLEGTTHSEVISWISETAVKNGITKPNATTIAKIITPIVSGNFSSFLLIMLRTAASEMSPTNN